MIDCTGLASYHGFLPTLTRNCIQALTGTEIQGTHNLSRPNTFFILLSYLSNAVLVVLFDIYNVLIFLFGKSFI